MMPRLLLTTVLALLPFLAAAQTQTPEQQAAVPRGVEGRFEPMNADKTGLTPSGTVRLEPAGGQIAIATAVEGASPGMHLMHVHGFTPGDPNDARCPTLAEADENGDGYIDLLETRKFAGVTMVPFNHEPAALEIGTETYPQADGGGQLTYDNAVDTLQLAAAVEHDMHASLELEKRVVFLLGVPEGVEVPDTVASLPGIPAAVTLPIACAELE